MANIEDIAGRFLVPSILRSTDNAYKFWSSFKEFDPRVGHLYNCLVKERTTLKTWVAQMNAAGYNGTSFLLGVKWRDVHVLLVELQQYMIEAEERHASTNEAVVDSQREVSKYLAKIKFIKAGYNDLNNIVEAMGRINKRLSALSPPPPPYVQESPSGELSRDREQSSTLALTGHGAVRNDTSDMSKPSHQTGHVPESSYLHGSVNTGHQERQSPKHSVVAAALDETFLNLQEVYSLCLRSLKCIAMSDDDCRTLAQLIGSRLKLWGVGLFEGSTSLDMLLRNDQLNCDKTRESLNKYMVVLLSYIDVVLKTIVEEQRCATAAIVNVLVEVQRLLSSNAAQTYILKQWQINFDANLTHIASDANDAVPDSEQASGQQPTNRTHGINYNQGIMPGPAARKMQHLQSASRLTEILFQLLSVFEILRSKYWRTQRQAAAKRVEQTVSTQYLTPVSRTHTPKPSQTNLVVVQRYIANRDEHIQKVDKKAVLFGPLFQKQQARLEEYKWSLGVQKQAEVNKQIEGLLASMVRDIESSSLQPDSKILQPQWIIPSKSTDSLSEDAKRSDNKEQATMLKDFVESFEQILTP